MATLSETTTTTTTVGTGTISNAGNRGPPQRSHSFVNFPEMFTYYNRSNLLQTFEAVQIRRQLLYAALTHFFIGLITILLTVLLGSTVTEAILAVWSLFCGVVGFGAICVHRAQMAHRTDSESVSFAKIWLQVYLGMTGLGAFLAAATVIHGAVLLGMSVPLQARRRNPSDLQDFITSSFSVWFVILGASNIFVGFAAGAADLLLIKKTLLTLRNHKNIVGGAVGASTVVDQPPRYLDVPPPQYTSTPQQTENGPLDVKGSAPQESPPSYEASLAHASRSID
ncbi:hypothetical protein BV898_03915 [Hypsibius exemplaris]|uniref:Uncharacterized protein n=1 Tax=Hypsibius exemplaris TaxID=2072580 RepID=A0A1W0X3J2_HYPEX|nr:hypothetical protein BV898_03915 [Hypsibius exemplaris]